MTEPNVVNVDRIAKLRYDFVDLRIAGERVKTRIADTQQKRYVGLSRSEELGKNEGMLFMYPEEKKHRLVMRDMDFPLDVIHVGADGHITKWESMDADGEAVEGVSKYAIEVPFGWCEKHDVSAGDPVHILEPPEEKQKLFKGRRYIDDPSEAPEDAEVNEGPQGGLWYETEDGEDDDSGSADEGGDLPEYDSDDPQWVDIDEQADADVGDVVMVWDDAEWERHVGTVTDTAGMTTSVELESGEEVTIDLLGIGEDLSIQSRFEEGRTEEDAEAEEDPFHDKPWDSEEEREEYLEEQKEERLQEINYYDIPDPDEGISTGADLSDDEIGNTEPNDFGVRAEEEDVDTLRETIESGNLGDELGVETNISEIPEDTPFGDSDFGRPEREDPYTDVAIDTEDYLNLQFELQHKYFPSGQDYEEHRRNFFGNVRVDDIKEYAETLQEEPGEMDYPYMFLRNDGSVGNAQEGRHRALAAWMAGVDKIPVRVILDASKEGDEKMAEKARRYVSSPEEVPEGYEPQEGPQGGIYYETGEGDEEGDETEPEPQEEPEWQELPDDPDWEEYEGMEFEVGGETFTIDEYHENPGAVSFVTTEEPLTGDEPGYIGEVDAEGITPMVFDEVREPTGETTGGADDTEPNYDEDEWSDPPDSLDELEDGQTLLIDTGRLQTATVNWATEDIVSTFLDESGEPYDITDEEDIVGVSGEGHETRVTPEEADSPDEMVDSIPFYGDTERLEDDVKDGIRQNAANVKDEETAKRILDHIKQFESMPGRAHVEFAAGKDSDRAAFNVGSSANRDTINHEFGHMAIDAHGLGIGTFAAREAMQEYDSQEDNFIQLDPDDEAYHLTPTEDEADPTPEIERLAQAVNEGWQRLQEGGEENAESLNIGSNYSATNAHEFMAALNEEMQKPRKIMPDGEVSWFDNHPELLPAYLDVFEPSEEMKVVISRLHEDRGEDSPFDENPFPDYDEKSALAEKLVRKARRYVDSPNEVPEEYEVQEGPQGGIYYETEESEEEAGAGEYGRDELRDIAGDNFYVETDVGIDDLSANSKGPFIVDRGNGPERVTAAGRLEGEIYDDGEDRFYWDDPSDAIPASEVEVLAAINPKRDEYGHLIDPEKVEIEKPESHEDFREWGLGENKKEEIAEFHGGDWWENRDAAEDLKQMAMERVYRAYGKGEGSTGGEVWGVLESWKRKGYDMQSELWEAAMAMTGKDTVPEHLADYDSHGIGDTDPDVVQALCDVIRLSRETAREEFGDTVTVTRAIGGHTFRQYAKETEDGVEIKPNIMESWSKEPEGAEKWAEFQAGDSGIRFGNHDTGPDYVVIEKEFDVEDIAFHGGIAMGATNETYKELTMAPQDDTYTVSEENIDRENLLSEEDLPDYMKQDDTPEEPGRMPWYASQWMYPQSPIAHAEGGEGDTKSEILSALTDTLNKRKVYVDSPEEVPEQYDVQEGPQGGIYYETGTDEEEEVDTEETFPAFEDMPDPEEVDPLSDSEVRELDYGETVWTYHGGDMMAAEVVHSDDLDAEFMQGGMMALPLSADSHEEAFSIYPPAGNTYVFGLAPDDPFEGFGDDGEIPFEQLEEGQEIVFEDYKGNTHVGEVSRVWDDRENLTVIADGSEYAVFPDDYEGVADEYGDTDIDVESDDLTGVTVEFENGNRGVVLNGEGAGLHVEMLTGPNQGEDIYGISRDTIEDVAEDEVDEDFGEGWENPEVDEMGMDERSDWVRENAYPHQSLKVYDRATGEVREAFIDADKLNNRTGNAYVQVKGGDKENYLLGNSNRFEVVGAETFDSLDYEGKFDSVVKSFQYGDFRDIDSNTRGKVRDNFFGNDYEGNGSLMRAKDWDTRRRVAESMNYIKNKVSRASCGGTRGSRTWRMKVSKDEDEDTIAHELGHAIAVSFGYDYEGENATEEYGPYNLSHEYTNYAGSWSDYIDWDLSDESSFYDPEQYMFTQWNGEGNAEKYAVGYDSFKEEVDEEIKQRFQEDEIVRESWETADYESPDEDASARDVFESLDEGDLVRFQVPDHDAGRDEDGNPLETEADYARFSHIDEEANAEGHAIAYFERANGDSWRWPVGPDGELYSDWSSVDGYATDPNVPDQDQDGDDRGSGGIPPEQQADTITEHLATRWDGFNEEAEKPEEKAENLMRAVNRAWYKQAKTHEASDDPTDRQKVVMETGYSATNAHETMAQLHEVMQTPTDSNKQRANDIFDEHPYLVLAYLDIWEPSPEMMEEMQELLQALGIEI